MDLAKRVFLDQFVFAPVFIGTFLSSSLILQKKTKEVQYISILSI